MAPNVNKGLRTVFPAYAGMSPSLAKHIDALTGFPRPRGDEPEPMVEALSAPSFSPPTRG